MGSLSDAHVRPSLEHFVIEDYPGDTSVCDIVLHIHVSQSFLSGLVMTLKIIKGHGYSSKKTIGSLGTPGLE